MRGPIILILVAILVVGIIFLLFWQFGILRQQEVSLTESQRKVESILQFIQNFDFSADFQKVRQKLPAGSVKEILPLATTELSVFDPFGLTSPLTTTTE